MFFKISKKIRRKKGHQCIIFSKLYIGVSLLNKSEMFELIDLLAYLYKETKYLK